MVAYEANFDGLVGPTHHYAGLSYGNVASIENGAAISSPREAALQGLDKMKALADLGFPQAVLPPQERPALAVLRAAGFTGSDADVLIQAQQHAPFLLAACSSASAMWTANAATVSPSVDTADGRVHFTAANLHNKLHRTIEHSQTSHTLQAIFADERYFAHHAALPSHAWFGDEGAANHTRFCAEYGQAGIAFFVYGQAMTDLHAPMPRRFPALQTREASQAIARQHGLAPERVVYAQQLPQTIDAGVFHNDVIAVGNRNVLFFHQNAFYQPQQVLAELRQKLQAIGSDLIAIEVPAVAVSVSEAVQSYLFNSQLLSRPDGSMCLVVPEECQQQPKVWRYLQNILNAGRYPITEFKVFDLQQSMQNGGGPACLRLRVVLTEAERAAVNPQVWINDQRYQQLTDWVNRHYRDRLCIEDLADPTLLQESRTALDELTQLLALGSIYPFQQD